MFRVCGIPDFDHHETEKYIAMIQTRHTDHGSNMTISNIAERERQPGKNTVVLHCNCDLKGYVNCNIMSVVTRHMTIFYAFFFSAHIRRSLQMFFASSLSYLHYLWVYLGIHNATSSHLAS